MSEQQRTNFEPLMVGAVAIYETPAVLARPTDIDVLPRFIVSREPFVQQSLSYVQNRVEEARAADPAIAGATVFGSTVKGYANPEESDVDVNIFIDADKLGVSLREDVLTTDICFPDWFPFNIHDRPLIGGEYREKVNRLFVGHKGITPDLPVSPAAIPISQGLMSLAAERELELADTQARYRALQEVTPSTWVDELTDWSQVPTNTDALQAIPGLAEAIRSDQELSSRIDVLTVASFLVKRALEEDTELARMRPLMLASQRVAPEVPLRLFGLAITPDLTMYRRAYLDRFAEAANPDRVWQFFSHRLAHFENSSKHPHDITKVAYPRSLDEAYNLYG